MSLLDLLSQPTIDAPWQVDIVLGGLMLLAGMASAAEIAACGHSVLRWITALAWFGLALRIGVALYFVGDVLIALASVPWLALLAIATIWRSCAAIGAELMHVHCIVDPRQPCRRADRVREAMVHAITFRRR